MTLVAAHPLHVDALHDGLGPVRRDAHAQAREDAPAVGAKDEEGVLDLSAPRRRRAAHVERERRVLARAQRQVEYLLRREELIVRQARADDVKRLGAFDPPLAAPAVAGAAAAERLYLNARRGRGTPSRR